MAKTIPVPFCNRTTIWWTLLVTLTWSFIEIEAATRQKNKSEDAEESKLDIPKVHFLVDMIGKQLYALVDNRKYKFYIYMTVGTLPSEESTIALLSTLCNVLYGCFVLLGFLFLRREYMLLFTLLTLYIGPAIILILIGTVALAIVAFAIYPVRSVLLIWLWFFVTSQLAQAIGKHLGLDSDKDGDVDMLDLIHWAASKRWGKFLGFPKLYKVLNQLTRDPFQEINQRLDTLMESLATNGSAKKEQ